MHTSYNTEVALDIPPAIFPDDACIDMPALPRPSSRGPKAAAAQATKPVVEKRAVRIARAKSGDTELRLFVVDGKTKRYLVGDVKIAPYSTVLTELKADRKPMGDAAAHAAFEQLVATKYPPVVLGNATVPTHENLL